MEDIIVIKVIDNQTLVINKGSKDGIRENFTFLVYYLDDEDVIDPITGKNLGKIEYVVGRGKPKHIQDNMTTITCIDKQRRNITRIVKESNPLFGVLSNKKEEITEPEIIDLDFENPKVGNRVKIINNN